MLGWRRGDGGRCFPCSALSSWPMFQPPDSAPPLEPLSSAVVVEQLEVAASIPQRQEMPHHKHQEVEPEHVYDCLLLLLLLRHLGPEKNFGEKKGSRVLRCQYIIVFSFNLGETVCGGFTKLAVAVMGGGKTAALLLCVA